MSNFGSNNNKISFLHLAKHKTLRTCCHVNAAPKLALARLKAPTWWPKLVFASSCYIVLLSIKLQIIRK